MKTKFIDPEVVRELLHYDPETGVFTWKYRNRGWFTSESACVAWNNKNSGKRAGYTTSKQNGYMDVAIRVLGIGYLAHRLAWVYMTGEQPPEVIDHRDRNATNNAWKNIRSGVGINQKNKSMHRNNTSGFTGVHFCKRTGAWVAKGYVVVDGQRKRKCLGSFRTKERAITARQKFNEQNKYSPQHGLAPAHYAKSGVRHV